MFLKVLLLLLIHQSISLENLECVSKIYRQTKSYTLVLQTFNTEKVKYFAEKLDPFIFINSNNIKNITDNRYKFNYNIILANNYTDYKKNIDIIYRTFSWNARAKFLIIFEDETNITKVFEYSWKIYLLNIIVLQKSDENIYTYFPYSDNKCGNVNPKIIGTCNELNNLYPNKVPKNLQGCLIKTLPLIYPPYVIKPNDTNNLNRGLEINMLNAIAEVANFTFIYLKHDFLHFGFKHGKEKYTNLFEMMYKYEGDMVFGTLKMNTSFHEEFDTIMPHMIDSVTWYAPIALEISSWKNIIIVFNTHLWVLIISMLMFNILIWWILGSINNESFYNNFLWCVTISFHTLLLGSVRQPKNGTVQIIFITWVLAALLLSTVYISKFTSILTNPVYDKQISNEQEIIQSGLEYGFDQMAKEEFNIPSDKLRFTIYNNFVACPFERVYHCINRTLVHRNFVTAKNKKHMIYSLRHFFNITDGRPVVYEFKQDAYRYFLRFCVNQGFPLTERIEEIVLRIQAAGLLQKWTNEVAKPFRYFKGDATVKNISMDHLQAAFLILLFGFIFSWAVFIVELVLQTIRRLQNVDNYIVY